VIQDILNGPFFRLALMLLEIGLELVFRFISVDEKLGTRAEHELTDVAVCHAGSAADESYDLEISVCHGNIIARTYS
jgi:hypothetical protein